ncbi:DUF3108 domain-containing protein [Parvibaculaceae bacterium PLY_AMNH_Bact1]|nr:DUF3108 domain-containing protein [Parvibaculaceae bacterium PLY_AMNH_Bact1]
MTSFARPSLQTLLMTGFVFFVALLYATAVSATEETTAEGETDGSANEVDLTFEIYGGGLHIVSFGTQATLTPKRYEIAAQFQTQGVADTLFNGRGSSTASGILTPAGPRLLSYSQEYDGRFGERSITMALDESGRYDVAAEPADGIHKQGFSASAVQGKVDPLTASIFTAINSTAAPCSQTIPVFDGRRIFNLKFKELDETQLQPIGAGAYAGPAWRCSVLYDPVAGFTREFLVDRAKNPLPPFTVWLARFNEQMGPSGNQPLVLPVRMMFETSIVNAIAHLTTAEVDGKALIQPAIN